jgi:hypothetical protein
MIWTQQSIALAHPATESILSFFGYNNQGSGNIYAIVMICMLWIGLQLLFFLHDTILRNIKSALPDLDLTLNSSDSLLGEFDRMEGFTYKFYANQMRKEDFSRLFSLYRDRATLSEEIKPWAEIYRESSNFTPARIVLATAIHIIYGGTEYRTVFWLLMLLLTINEVFNQYKRTVLKQFVFTKSNQIASLELLKGRLDRELVGDDTTDTPFLIDNKRQLIIGLTSGIVSVRYLSKRLVIRVGPLNITL